RDIKNESGLAHVGLAEHTGLPLDRVKCYFSLFAASDDLLTFLERNEIPLKVAVELVRYERATNEARARRLMDRHKETPLTVQEIVALRRRDSRRDARTEAPPRPARATRYIEKLEAVLRRDPATIQQLQVIVQRLGYQLVSVSTEAKA